MNDFELVTTATFDGGYGDNDNLLYTTLHRLIPNEREKVIEVIRNEDEDAFEYFKDDCLRGFYDNLVEEGHITVNPPVEHTPEELDRIIKTLLGILFNRKS